MLVEICANSYKSAKNAEQGGAHRLELCEDLAIGGITPNRELMQRVVSDLSIPVNILIRPRGGDFVYSEEEFDQMISDIEFCKSIGCNGIVSGILNKDNTIDVQRTKELIDRSRPLSFTFHRAFDDTLDPVKALQGLKELGADRILTSGQAKTAIEGLNTLEQLKNVAGRKLIVLVAGRVRSSNALVFKKAGFKEVHSSAITDSAHSDLEEIKKIVQLTSS